MSATLFKDVKYSLTKLIEDIDIGEIGLPEIQRPFVWSNAKVRDLFDSMYKGFPVGYLLFWANSFSGEQRQIGTRKKQKTPHLLIVDGQQRLTSLYAVLKGQPVIRSNYKKEKIRIAFRPRDEAFEVADAAIIRNPEFISDISELWSGNLNYHRFLKKFIKKLKTKIDVSSKEEDILIDSIDRLRDLNGYPFTALELSHTVDEVDVSDVFVRINSKGTTLKQADFILTLMSVFWDKGRANLEKFCRESRIPTANEESPFNYFLQPDPDQLLRVSIALGFRRAALHHVYNILRGKDLETGEFSSDLRDIQMRKLRNAQSKVLNIQNWHEFFKCLLSAGFRRSDMISSKVAILYAYSFYLIGKYNYKMDHFLLRKTIARWFFMISVSARYSFSPESAMERDLNSLRDVKGSKGFVKHLNGIIEESLTQDFWNITIPNRLASTSARSPALFGYYASLNLLDAKGLFSNLKISELLEEGLKAKKSPLERHHLFPKKYLERIGIAERTDINQIANYALVEWADNIQISDKAPSNYYSKYAKRFSKVALNRMHKWHALPKGWESMDYKKFLDKRRKLMAKIVREGFETLN